MGGLLDLPFSCWLGTWSAGLQSKGRSIWIKDSCLGPQCLPLACLGALGRATCPLPHLCPAFCGEDRYSEAGRGSMGFFITPGPQSYPQGRPVSRASVLFGEPGGLATMGSESRGGGEDARELDTAGLDALGLRGVRPLLFSGSCLSLWPAALSCHNPKAQPQA